MTRWNINANDAVAHRMLLTKRPEGYVGCCAAIAETDFHTTTSGLRLPTLAIAGGEDRVILPDMVRETCDLIPGARIQMIRRAGHLPCMDQPQAFAQAITRVLEKIGHLWRG